jgi:glutamate-5-semialdehyde dehydrogenase
LLIDQAVARQFLPRIAQTLAERKVELRGDGAALQILCGWSIPAPAGPDKNVAPTLSIPIKPATEDDWYKEYLDLIIAVRVVDGVGEAIDHITKYGSAHSDAIVTHNKATAEKFLREVDSSSVFWNASTRLADGGQYGFGAEIGISTDKLHARGPMGLEELTSYKFVVVGDGQLRE